MAVRATAIIEGGMDVSSVAAHIHCLHRCPLTDDCS
jgi:hypothetical protein